MSGRTGTARVTLGRMAPKDGRKKHPLYGRWMAMLQRCHSISHPLYPKYGAKGISVCDRWRRDFMAFANDMGERPSGASLDRINVLGNYEPGNCRWADGTTQAANQSLSRRNTIGFRGVVRVKGRFHAKIRINGRPTYVGSYTTAREAALAYDRACLEHRRHPVSTNASLGLLEKVRE